MRKTLLLLLVFALPQLGWGQLMLFRTTLSGANEVPPRETSAFGTGQAMLDLDSKMFMFNYTFDNLVAPQTAAHIHVAPPGVNGPVLYPLPMGRARSGGTVGNRVVPTAPKAADRAGCELRSTLITRAAPEAQPRAERNA